MKTIYNVELRGGHVMPLKPEPSGYRLTDEMKQLIAQYIECFVNTGGNDVIELIERPGVNFFNNAPAAALQVACYSQVCMLVHLKRRGLLKEPT